MQLKVYSTFHSCETSLITCFSCSGEAVEWQACIRTGTWPSWSVWCRCPCRVQLLCYRWTTVQGASCASCRTPEDCSCTSVWSPAGLTWLRSACTASCCPWSIAEGKPHTTAQFKVRAYFNVDDDERGSTLKTLAQYSKEYGLLTS